MRHAPPTVARARLGVSLMFFVNGVLFSALLPRYPEVKAAFDLTGTQFGLLVICMPLGAVAAATSAGPLVRRFGTRTVNAAGSILLAIVLALAVQSPVALLFAAALLIAGATDAIIDAAMNIQGVVVEEWKGRSIINSFHAIWSLGATTGGLIGTWCAATGVALTTQMAVNGAGWALVALIAAMLARTPHDDRGAQAAEAATDEVTDAADDATLTAGTGTTPGTAAGAGRSGRRARWHLLLPLVVLAICGTLMEEVANSWSALFLQRETGAPDQLAGLAFTVVLAAQFVGRLVGDRMTDRWGRDAVARFGGLLVAVGMGIAMATPWWPLVLVGFACLGFGCATLVPAAFAAAARVPGLPHGTGVALVGWLMRLGFLLTSPVVGVISDTAGLRAALLVPLGAGLLAAYLAHRLERRSVG